MKTAAIFCILVPLISTLSAGDSLDIGFGTAGLGSLRFAGSESLARGTFIVNAVSFVDRDGHISAGSTQCKRTEDLANKAQTLSFEWGTVHVSYTDQSDSLRLAVEILNRSQLTLRAISLDALALQLPFPPREYDGKTPMLGTNIGAPTLLPLDSKNGSVLVINEDVKKPLLLGMPWSLNSPVNTIFPVRINTGRDAMYPNSLPYIDRPIPAGEKDSFLISLHFSASDVNIAASAKDVLTRFAGLHEFALHWPDRRPIGSLILATAATQWSGNPRGWLLDPKIEVHTPDGLAEFHRRVLLWADHAIGILLKMNAQGMITWDIEGEEFPHPTTYIGDPSASGKLAPEMASILDDYFRRFRAAGLRVGITIRPQRLEQTEASPKQTESPDPAAELIRKISYARKRWGATLFYIDSNGDAVLPASFDVIAKVAQTFPDVLLIPEHKNVAYYSRSAPYIEARGGFYSTPGLITSIYPNSLSVINTADGQVEKHYSDLLAAVNRGDILMFRGWFDDPANVMVKAIYAQSRFKAH